MAAEAGISVREWNARGWQAASGLMCIPGFGGIARTPMAPSTQREVSCSRGTWWRTAAAETWPLSRCPRPRVSGYGEAENRREETSDHRSQPRAKWSHARAQCQHQPKVGSTRLNAVSRHARLQEKIQAAATSKNTCVPRHTRNSRCAIATWPRVALHSKSAFRGASATLLVGSRTRGSRSRSWRGQQGGLENL